MSVALTRAGVLRDRARSLGTEQVEVLVVDAVAGLERSEVRGAGRFAAAVATEADVHAQSQACHGDQRFQAERGRPSEHPAVTGAAPVYLRQFVRADVEMRVRSRPVLADKRPPARSVPTAGTV